MQNGHLTNGHTVKKLDGCSCCCQQTNGKLNGLFHENNNHTTHEEIE